MAAKCAKCRNTIDDGDVMVCTTCGDILCTTCGDTMDVCDHCSGNLNFMN